MVGLQLQQSIRCNSTKIHGTKDLIIHPPTEPTHFCEHGGPDILDLWPTVNIPQQLTVNFLSELSSDHNPISTEIKTTLIEIKKINWTKFKTLNTIQQRMLKKIRL